MIYIYEEFGTEKEALEFREGTYQNYHPLGYGTYIVVERSKKTADKWIAHGHRAESCD